MHIDRLVCVSWSRERAKIRAGANNLPGEPLPRSLASRESFRKKTHGQTLLVLATSTKAIRDGGLHAGNRLVFHRFHHRQTILGSSCAALCALSTSVCSFHIIMFVCWKPTHTQFFFLTFAQHAVETTPRRTSKPTGMRQSFSTGGSHLLDTNSTHPSRLFGLSAYILTIRFLFHDTTLICPLSLRRLLAVFVTPLSFHSCFSTARAISK